jgi:hypothetical protein
VKENVIRFGKAGVVGFLDILYIVLKDAGLPPLGSTCNYPFAPEIG